jgi:hypothetical protein
MHGGGPTAWDLSRARHERASLPGEGEGEDAEQVRSPFDDITFLGQALQGCFNRA